MLQIKTKGRPDSRQTGLANSSRDPLGTEENGSPATPTTPGDPFSSVPKGSKGPRPGYPTGALGQSYVRLSPCVYELLLDELKLIGADAAHRAHIILGQLGRIDLNLVTTNDANELIRLLLLSHDVLLSNVTAGVLAY